MRWLAFALGGLAAACALFSGLSLEVASSRRRAASVSDRPAFAVRRPPAEPRGRPDASFTIVCPFPPPPPHWQRSPGLEPPPIALPSAAAVPLGSRAPDIRLRPVALEPSRMPRCTKDRVAPEWPDSARRRGVSSGSVLVEFDLSADGAVVHARVIESTPRGVFERGALRAASSWCFPPADEADDAALRRGKRVRLRFESERT